MPTLITYGIETHSIGESMSDAPSIESMRQPAEWMTPSDDRILELVRENGNLTPKAIDDFGGPSRQYTSSRCATLADHGLLERVHRGLYGITDKGRAYLDEDLDASTLEPPHDIDSPAAAPRRRR